INRTEPRAYCAELYLFWASTPLTSAWQPHPGNPILPDPLTARNGGLLRAGADIIRVGQCQGFRSHRTSASFFRIQRISRDEYQEELVCRITPDVMPAIHGTHHFHSDGVYCVWDFKKWARM